MKLKKLAKILYYPSYVTFGSYPINILKYQKLLNCRSFKDLNTWINQILPIHTWNMKSLCNKEISNKNVIIAGFPIANLAYNTVMTADNFPTMENLENLFLVGNDNEFNNKLINNLKNTHKTNPNIYIICAGLIDKQLPIYPSIRTKLFEIKTPVYFPNFPNKEDYMDTQRIIDFINDRFYEENIMMTKE